MPGAGDDVQALKAGIMEIADIFVVNKADREGADRTVASIEAMLSLQPVAEGHWRPPIVKTEASTGKGVVELLDTVEQFRAHDAAARDVRRRARAEWRVRELLAHRFVRHVHDHVLARGRVRVAARPDRRARHRPVHRGRGDRGQDATGRGGMEGHDR